MCVYIYVCVCVCVCVCVYKIHTHTYIYVYMYIYIYIYIYMCHDSVHTSVRRLRLDMISVQNKDKNLLCSVSFHLF